MTAYSTLAAVDLGSNSFHLQVVRVDGDQLYPLDSLRDPVRLGAGLTKDKRLDEPSQERALECLRHFGERLRGFDPHSVRCVGTNTLRVAKNAAAFLKKAQAALGFPIEVVAGREEARLIYLGVSHSLPASKALRLVVDIGGGSTEFIIGRGHKPLKLESLYMGCVSYSLRYFPGGHITKSAMKEAELAARTRDAAHHRQPMPAATGSKPLPRAAPARALAELIELNGFGDGGITRGGARCAASGDGACRRHRKPRAGRRAHRPPARAPRRAGDHERRAARARHRAHGRGLGRDAAGHPLRLLGRFTHHDMRDATVQQFMQRYHVDARQAKRVAALAVGLYGQFSTGNGRAEADEQAPQYLEWAAMLHEIGITVAYSGYNRHSAYILRNADMPGFARAEQEHLARLVLAHRRSLRKILPELEGLADWREVMALRLAALFYRSRSDTAVPEIRAKVKSRSFRVKVDRDWLKKNPLTVAALREEIEEWAAIGVALEVKVLDEIEAPADLALAG